MGAEKFFIDDKMGFCCAGAWIRWGVINKHMLIGNFAYIKNGLIMVDNASGDWGCESLLSKGTTLRSRSRISKIILNYADNARCRFRTWKPPLCKGVGTHWAAMRLNRRRGCWKLKNSLSISARDEFSVTLKIAVTIKIDVTEKLSRNLTSATDWFKADKNSCLY